MILTKMAVEWFIFLLTARICFAGIMIEIPVEDTSNLIKPTVTILKSCYQGQYNTIGIGGHSSDSLISSLSSETDLSVILIDNTKRSVRVERTTEWNVYKLQMFVITVSSSTQLRKQLADIKKTRWWNHMATFYIIHLSLEKNGCARAFEFLWEAWSMNILRAKFVCNRNVTERTIYSFNPYTRYAPVQWRLEKFYNGHDNHPWALLVRKYTDDRKMCENMDFDATKNLGGYTIRVADYTGVLKVSTRIRRLYRDFTDNNFRAIFPILNATVKTIHWEREGRKIRDIGSQPGKAVEAYPHYFSSVSIMSRYTGDKSQLNKIISAIDRASRIGVCIVCVITAIFLKYSLHQSPMTAFLSTLRLVCNSGLTKLPIDTPSRIYLTGLFVLVVTIHGIYSGLLAALLAKRAPYPNIDTPQDLFESGHKIYLGMIVFRSYIGTLPRHVRMGGITARGNCSYYIIREPKSACIDFLDAIIPEAAKFKFHLSKEYYVPVFSTIPMRRDWPLEQRFNSLIQRLVESNTIQYSYQREFDKDWRTIEETEIENIDRTRKILELSDLDFAFVILGIGLTLATIIFVIENIFSRFVRSRVAKARRRFCPRLAR